jgi:hypothetical protein
MDSLIESQVSDTSIVFAALKIAGYDTSISLTQKTLASEKKVPE